MVELLPVWIIVSAVCGAVVGNWCGDVEQGIYWGAIIGWTPVGLLYAIVIWHNQFVGDQPKCHCGSKDKYGLEFMRKDVGSPVQDEFECRSCGRRYRFRKNTFYEIATDGIEIPYAKQRGLLPWKYLDDQGSD